jgi:hypothetical protein
MVVAMAGLVGLVSDFVEGFEGDLCAPLSHKYSLATSRVPDTTFNRHLQ